MLSRDSSKEGLPSLHSDPYGFKMVVDMRSPLRDLQEDAFQHIMKCKEKKNLLWENGSLHCEDTKKGEDGCTSSSQGGSAKNGGPQEEVGRWPEEEELSSPLEEASTSVVMFIKGQPIISTVGPANTLQKETLATLQDV